MAAPFFKSCESCDIRGESLFAGLCDHELAHLDVQKSCVSYKKGQELFQEHSAPTGVYCLNKGKVKISKIGQNGKEQIIKIHKPGDLIGFRSILAKERYHVSAETIEESELCFVPKEDFLKLHAENSVFQDKLLQEVCRELQEDTNKILSLAQMSIRERTAAVLLMLDEIYRSEEQEGEQVFINLTREDLANFIGTATESLIRQLTEFKTDGFLEIQGRKLSVIDKKSLIKIAGI